MRHSFSSWWDFSLIWDVVFFFLKGIITLPRKSGVCCAEYSKLFYFLPSWLPVNYKIKFQRSISTILEEGWRFCVLSPSPHRLYSSTDVLWNPWVIIYNKIDVFLPISSIWWLYGSNMGLIFLWWPKSIFFVSNPPPLPPGSGNYLYKVALSFSPPYICLLLLYNFVILWRTS